MFVADSLNNINKTPLCVDLDGTILKTDSLFECLICALRDWHTVVRIPVWFIGGKAKFKAKLAQHSKIDTAFLPYDEKILDYLRAQKEAGRYLILATAANRSIAEAINKHLGLFDEVIASDDTRNLRGKEKAALLLERFGYQKFDYIGNDRTDLHVFRFAQNCILVNATKYIEKKANEVKTTKRIPSDRPSLYTAAIKALRPYQWTKNLLIFVPIVTSNAFSNIYAMLNAAVMFLAFCATASSIYLINDLFDLEADRHHPEKCKRPFASGSLPLAFGLVLIPIFLIIGFTLAFAVALPLFVLGYAAMSTAYSVKFKKMPLIDLFILAALYTIRLFAGGEVTGYHVSFWLLAYSGFLFLSLAVIKRVSELKIVLKADGASIAQRGYTPQDMNLLQQIGISSSFISGLVFALYTQSGTVETMYKHPKLLWMIIPLMLFWQCRLWMATSRGYMHSDPIVYAAKDWVSILVGLSLIIILVIANISF